MSIHVMLICCSFIQKNVMLYNNTQVKFGLFEKKKGGGMNAVIYPLNSLEVNGTIYCPKNVSQGIHPPKN